MVDEKPTFESNAAAFERDKTELLQHHAGKFALFHDNAFVDAFDTFEGAYAKGIEIFGFDPIFIGLIDEVRESFEAPALLLGILNARS